jgi:hypothetical protein
MTDSDGTRQGPATPMPSPAATLTPPLSHAPSPPPPHREREIRAASPIDRLEGSIVTEMVVNQFRKTQ